MHPSPSIAPATNPSPVPLGEGRLVWTKSIELAAQGVPFALATVVRAARPASCRAGDRAIVFADGRLEGWVGGSCAQPTVVAEALAALRDGEARLVAVTPHHDFPAREGMAVHPMTCVSGGEIEVFVEPVLPPPQLVVCGVSPVAMALVAIGAAAGFEVVVVDPDAAVDRFPAASIVLTSLEVTADSPLSRPRERHVIAATHGRWDEAAIDGAIRLLPKYVGLVASRTRFAATISELVATGVEATELEIVRSRPGLDLGGQTPSEVALGIIAEIVALRNDARVRVQTRQVQNEGMTRTHEIATDSVEAATHPSDSSSRADGTHPKHNADSKGSRVTWTASSQVSGAFAGAVADEIFVEDPICGMSVDTRTSLHWLEHDGLTWHYCNAKCRRVHARQLGIELPVQALRPVT